MTRNRIRPRRRAAGRCFQLWAPPGPGQMQPRVGWNTVRGASQLSRARAKASETYFKFVDRSCESGCLETFKSSDGQEPTRRRCLLQWLW